MEATTHLVPREDGEVIRVADFDEPEGKPLLVHSGSPGSRWLFRPDAEVAVRRRSMPMRSNCSSVRRKAGWPAGATRQGPTVPSDHGNVERNHKEDAYSWLGGLA
jgi:hypothetical protein